MRKIRLVTVALIISFFTLCTSCKDSKRVNQKKSSKTIIENPEWAIDLIEAYKALNTERNITSANLLFEASEKMPKKNWENCFVAATIFASNNDPDKAFKALGIALQAGLRDVELVSTYPDLSKLKNDSRWSEILEKTKAKKQEYIKRIKNPEVLTILEEMWAADQKALSDYEKNINLLDSTATQKDYDSLFQPIEEQWDKNKASLDSIIAIHGWPGNKLVGEDGAKLAWAIPQHHPDVFYKKKCLVLMKALVDKGDLDPNHYAELNDRIARETWQKQTYGASMGKTAPYPIKDPINVNKRRIELGLLEPIEVYAYYHGIEYNIPQPEEVKTIYDKAQSDYRKFEEFADSKIADSVNVYINKAIKSYGDIDNEQLYQAALKLSKTNDEQSEKLSLKILKVLIWREWEDRFERINATSFKNLQNENGWQEIEKLKSMSR